MAGIEERVKGFLDSWPKVKEQLEELMCATVAAPEEEGIEGKNG